MEKVLKLAGHPHIRREPSPAEEQEETLLTEIERDERIEVSQERRQDRVDAKREDEEEFDFERDCGARP